MGKITEIFRLVSAAIVAIILPVSCDKSVDGQEPDTGDVFRSVFIYDGVETPVAKAFVNVSDAGVEFYATPSDDVDGISIFNKASYIWLMADPVYAVDVAFNVKDEPFQISGYNIADGTLFNFDDETRGDILSGTLRIQYDSALERYRVFLDVVLSNGKSLEMTAEAVVREEQEDVFEENYYSVNNVGSKIRMAFYDDVAQDDIVRLYLTSADIDYASELGSASNYVEIALRNDMLDGTEVEIAGSDIYYQISYFDNFNGTSSSASSESPSDMAEGTVSVVRNGENFTVKLNAMLPGVIIEADYSGPAVSSELMPPPPPNEFVFNGAEPVSLQSAVVGKPDADGYREVWLSAEAGVLDSASMDEEDIHISAPSSCFDGDIYGFSVLADPRFYVEYGGIIWAYSAGAGTNITGTLEASLSDDSITIHFYNLKNGDNTLEIYYAGQVVIEE